MSGFLHIPPEVDPGDPGVWGVLPDGFTAVVATELEDRGWSVSGRDDDAVHVVARDGTGSGVWFVGGACYTGRRVRGRCDAPVNILADVTDPEQIADRADTAMRALGLRPGRPDDVERAQAAYREAFRRRRRPGALMRSLRRPVVVDCEESGIHADRAAYVDELNERDEEIARLWMALAERDRRIWWLRLAVKKAGGVYCDEDED